MSRLTEYSLLIVISAFISAFSQIMLKKSAQKKYDSKLKEYLNPLVMASYAIFVLCTLITMFALKLVPLSMSPILEATGYIFIPILSYIFFKEALSKRQLLGIVLVIGGIIVYSLA